MNKRVTIQNRAESGDGYGGIVISWGDFKTVWAKIDLNPGNRYRSIADQLQTQSLIVVTTRYNQVIDEIPPKQMTQRRIVFNERAYKILGITRVNAEKYFLEFYLDGNSWQSV
jgi:SPP1 family predicted phage head-tail adaptor